MKKTVLIAFAAMTVLMFASKPAHAVFSLGGYEGPVTFDLVGFSQSQDSTFISNANGGETWGVFRLNSISDGGINTLWNFGQDDQRIYGFFHGLLDESLIVPSGQKQIDQISGEFGMYIYEDGDASDEFDVDTVATHLTNRSAVGTYETITDGGSLFLSGDFVPGIDTDSTTIRQNFNFDTGQGDGEGYADVTGGAFAALFNTSATPSPFGGLTDFNFNFTVNGNAVPTGLSWFAQINDPVIGNAQAIPEPMSMILFGSGLAGAALRRKFNV